MELEHSKTLNDWNQWKKTLSTAIDFGQMVGLSENSIEKIGSKVGSFLASTVDPENREQRLLKELWEIGDDQERKTLTKMLVKMVESDQKKGLH